MNETTQTLKTDEQSEVSLSSKLAGKPAEEKDMITLKWGTLKAWDIKTEKAKELLKKYSELGMSFGAMQQPIKVGNKEYNGVALGLPPTLKNKNNEDENGN